MLIWGIILSIKRSVKMNKNIQKIFDLSYNALMIEKKGIFIDGILRVIEKEEYKTIKPVLDEMLNKLQSGKIDNHPNVIFEYHFPSQRFFADSIWAEHYLFYFKISLELSSLFNELLSLKKWDNKQRDKIQENHVYFSEIFNINGMDTALKDNSQWYWDTQNYAKWKDGQYNKVDTVKKKLKKLDKILFGEEK
jgi:hypothetical protein